MRIPKIIFISYLLFAISYLLFIPFFANAALWIGGNVDSLAPDCGTKTVNKISVPAPCNLCDLLKMGQNIIKFLIYTVAPALTIIFVAWGGIQIMIYGGEEKKRAEAKDIIYTAAIGYAIVLISWLAVNEIFTLFVKSAFSKWYNLSC